MEAMTSHANALYKLLYMHDSLELLIHKAKQKANLSSDTLLFKSELSKVLTCVTSGPCPTLSAATGVGGDT